MITVAQILKWGPCEDYTKARIKELVGSGLTPRQVAELDIPADDRYWVLMHLLRREDVRMLTASIAERLLMLADITNEHLWYAIQAGRLRGCNELTDAELATAWRSALDSAVNSVEWHRVPNFSSRVCQNAVNAATPWTSPNVGLHEAWAAYNSQCDLMLIGAGSHSRTAACEQTIADALRLIEAATGGEP